MSADTAPAAMPGVEIRRIIEDALCEPNTVEFAVASLEALFAPILAEKEREIERACSDHANATIGWERERGRAETLEARALAAEAALAAERERIATNLDAQADALWERCETKRSNPPSVDEQADAAQAFALQKAAAAIRAHSAP